MGSHVHENAFSRIAQTVSASGWSLVRIVLTGTAVLVLAIVSLTSGVFASKAIYIERADAEEQLVEQAGSSDAISDVSGSEDAGSPVEHVVVDVSGAVTSPSVVTLPAGSRVQDAIDAAGGLTDDADISTVNRAALVTDGSKVVVPRKGEEPPASSRGAGTVGAGDAAAGLININTASAVQLDTLPGVGPSTAAAIIEDREANGPFTAPEDLMRVSGIGEKKYAKLESLICV